jgi:beta-galactosidase
MEQQPGPVNWAPNNPAPLPGMVRLWTLEAFAHSAELVSYFRWRQAPFGQEQMHAGLLRPDSVEDVAASEVRAVAPEVAALREYQPTNAPVALLFSYDAQWLLGIQPQGSGFDPLRMAFEFYSGLRKLGLDVDILPPDADLEGYALVVAPSLPIIEEELVERIAAAGSWVLFGPRSGSKTVDFQIPPNLPPGPLQDRLPLRITRVESLRTGHREAVTGADGGIVTFLEHVETDLEPLARLDGGAGIWFRQDRFHYLAGWPDETLLASILAALAGECGLATVPLADGLRLRRRGSLRLAFNYAPEPVELPAGVASTGMFLLGGRTLPPAGVAAWIEA